MLHLQIVLPVTAKCLLRLVKADQSELGCLFSLRKALKRQAVKLICIKCSDTGFCSIGHYKKNNVFVEH